MKVNIVSSVFQPEPVMSAHTSTDLACELTSYGHMVRVITTFPNRPAGKIYKGYQRNLWTYEQPADGYDLLRIFTFFSSQSNLFSRFLENVSFGISTIIAILLLEKPDVIYANTWPLFAQGLLVLTCKLLRIPLVLSIQDLYPESLIVQKRGFNKISRLYLFLRLLDGQIAKNCSALIVISEQFKSTYILDRGIAKEKVTVIPNWIGDLQAAIPSIETNIRRKLHIPQDAFLLVYGGNIGVAAGVEGLIDIFQFLPDQDRIYLLIAGAGSRLSHCQELVQKYGFEHVKFLSPWHTEDTFEVLSAADLCVLPTQGEQSLVSVPSKLLAYMLAGRPVCAFTSPESETARIITVSRAGWVIPSTDPEYWATAITEISNMPKEFQDQRGHAAQNFVRENFSKSRNVPKVLELLLDCGRKYR